MRRRILSVLVLAALVLALAGAGSASEPLWTQRATIEFVAPSGLLGHNGGWRSDDDPNLTFSYLFRFVRDDGFATTARPPQRETHDQARARLLTGPQRYQLRTIDFGHSWRVEVYAVVFSGAWGNEPAWAEWGFHDAPTRALEPNRSDPVFVQAQTSPPPPPSTAPRVVMLTTARTEIARWRTNGVSESTIRATRIYRACADLRLPTEAAC